jgi:hypothetical protein
MDFAINETTGDLDLKNGDFYFVTDVDAVVQFIAQRLRLFSAEWFLDETRGIAYFDRVFVKNPNPVELDSIFKSTILDTPGVLELLSFDISVNTTLRRLTVAARVRAYNGEASLTESLILPGGA